jgi:protocatechuate 3,4-dioxygenase beta subunit
MDGAHGDDRDGGLLADLSLRVGAAADPALAAGLVAAVRHAHALVTELRPTPDGLRAVIDFLTEVGHSADARRQEWVLLADVIGVSTLVEDLAADLPPGATPNTLAGPFYRDDAPAMDLGATISRDGRGVPLAVAGRVRDLSGGAVAAAVVEVWQANSEGLYENQEPDLQPEFNLRGRFRTDAAGRFHYRSVRPKGYFLPEDGPVGRLLNRLGYRLERPAHLHFRISAPGYRTLTTHVFDRADPAIGRDALFGVKPALLGDFRPDGRGGWQIDTGFTLAPAATAGVTGGKADRRGSRT